MCYLIFYKQDTDVKKILDNRKNSDYLRDILQKFILKFSIIWK